MPESMTNQIIKRTERCARAFAHGATAHRAAVCECHRLEQTLLYQLVERHYPDFHRLMVLQGTPLATAPYRQWVLSAPFQLRFLFASYPDLMGKALGIVTRCIATDLIHRAGLAHDLASQSRATLAARVGSGTERLTR